MDSVGHKTHDTNSLNHNHNSENIIEIDQQFSMLVTPTTIVAICRTQILMSTRNCT